MSIVIDVELLTVTDALPFAEVKSIKPPAATAAEFCVNPAFAISIKSLFCVSVSVPEYGNVSLPVTVNVAFPFVPSNSTLNSFWYWKE